MGQVYRARDTRLDRLVAIKVIAPQVTADPVARGRFEREAKIVSSLDHPNICAVYDVGEHDDAAFLVMQYLEGRTLAEVIPTRPSLDDVRRIAADLAAALTCAHGRGILHRDIKPQNIMVLPDGRAVLLDFGIARSQVSPSDVTIAETREGLTAAGALMGTLEYHVAGTTRRPCARRAVGHLQPRPRPPRVGDRQTSLSTRDAGADGVGAPDGADRAERRRATGAARQRADEDDRPQSARSLRDRRRMPRRPESAPARAHRPAPACDGATQRPGGCRGRRRGGGDLAIGAVVALRPRPEPATPRRPRRRRRSRRPR